jgi:hypothetical protein
VIITGIAVAAILAYIVGIPPSFSAEYSRTSLLDPKIVVAILMLMLLIVDSLLQDSLLQDSLLLIMNLSSTTQIIPSLSSTTQTTQTIHRMQITLMIALRIPPLTVQTQTHRFKEMIIQHYCRQSDPKTLFE